MTFLSTQPPLVCALPSGAKIIVRTASWAGMVRAEEAYRIEYLEHETERESTKRKMIMDACAGMTVEEMADYRLTQSNWEKSQGLAREKAAQADAETEGGAVGETETPSSDVIDEAVEKVLRDDIELVDWTLADWSRPAQVRALVDESVVGVVSDGKAFFLPNKRAELAGLQKELESEFGGDAASTAPHESWSDVMDPDDFMETARVVTWRNRPRPKSTT